MNVAARRNGGSSEAPLSRPDSSGRGSGWSVPALSRAVSSETDRPAAVAITWRMGGLVSWVRRLTAGIRLLGGRAR